MLAQLRSGASFMLARYRHKIQKATSEACLRCRAPVDDTAHLLLDCPALAVERLRCLGPEPNLEMLVGAQQRVVDFVYAVQPKLAVGPSDSRGARGGAARPAASAAAAARAGVSPSGAAMCSQTPGRTGVAHRGGPSRGGR